ncbi:hypothetical protein Esi_0047_0014 [Ectocarpus siliculosus]|uniref:Uncharacterized protein n=1 Tax=Ectocarpus siliculosus TaxID=2880 RepID=D7G269_ECTSI|nr:hypothetical protein Esi_0047_0014 [Ectocarpus siliculosus]|eukprot:CBJ48746.1 hypothetical protein Esi_0047_0014 [Ectocarpus siliculosus]
MWSDFRLALGEFNGKLLETVDTAEGTPSGALARTSREDTIKAITQLKVKVSSSQFATPADWAASLPGTLGSEVLKTLEANVDFAGAGEKSVLSLKQPTRRLAARVFCNGWNAWVHHDCAQFVQGLRTTSMGDTYKSFDKQDEDNSWLSRARLPRTSADTFVDKQLRASLIGQGATTDVAHPVHVRKSTSGCLQSVSRVDVSNRRRAARLALEDERAARTTTDGEHHYHRLPVLIVRKRKPAEALEEAHSFILRVLARRVDQVDGMPASSFFLELATITDSWERMPWAQNVVPKIRKKATVVKDKMAAAQGDILSESLGGL